MLFGDTIMIQGVRAGGRRIVAPDLPATVVDDGVPSDSVEDHLVSQCDQFTFFIRSAEWPIATPPQVGDIVRRESDDARTFKVTRVARLGDCYSLNCRGR